MSSFYVNRNAQPTGEHEVHRSGCDHFPLMHNAQYLGEFTNCHDAVAAAGRIYYSVDGCYHCCNACHNR